MIAGKHEAVRLLGSTFTGDARFECEDCGATWKAGRGEAPPEECSPDEIRYRALVGEVGYTLRSLA